MWRWVTETTGVVLLVLLAAGWVVLAPLELGGQATYVTTAGVSMLPTYHSGDLVILRRAPQYEVGDAVAYLDPQIGRIFHRIVGQQGDRYLMKGDNNNFIDLYNPRVSDILGRLWLHVPDAGRILIGVRQPPVAAALVGGSILLVVGAGTARRPRRRFLHRSGPGSPTPRGPSGPGSTAILGGVGQALLVGTVGLALLAGVLGVVAFGAPIDRQATTPVLYKNTGTLAYTSTSPFGVYDSTVLLTGQPVYSRINESVQMKFDYQLEASVPVIAQGTAGLAAVVRGNDGWVRTFVLQPPVPFAGTSASVGGVLDLALVQRVIDRYVNVTTGSVPAGGRAAYTVDVAPVIAVDGSVGGAPLHDRFEPKVTFTLNAGVLVPPQPSTLTADPFAPRVDGSATATSTVPNAIPLLFMALPVTTLRSIAVVGLVAALVLLLVLLLLVRRAARADEPSRIQARHGQLLVAVRGSLAAVEGRIFEVQSIDDLVRVAQREGRMMLHEAVGKEHAYYVQDVDVTYRYRTSTGETVDESVATETIG